MRLFRGKLGGMGYKKREDKRSGGNHALARTGTRDPKDCNRFFAIGQVPEKGRIRLNAATDDERGYRSHRDSQPL